MQAVDDLDQPQDAHRAAASRSPAASRRGSSTDREAARAAISAAAGWFTALLRETDDIERLAAHN
jgi:hypothetical protein